MIGLSMLIVCSKAQVSGNKICLTQSEIDYFVNQDLTAKSLVVDSTLKGIKIRRCDSINNEIEKNNIDLKANEWDLKIALKDKGMIIENYKVNLSKCREDYNNKDKLNKIYKKIIIGSFSIIIVEAGLIYLFTR